MATLGDKLVDKRIIDRNIEKGLISKEEYDQHVTDLPDKEGDCERVAIDPGDSGDEPSQE